MNSYLIINKDDKLSESIEEIINDFTNFYRVGHVFNYEDAMNAILKQKPDLVFLNLDNVIKDNFGLVKELHSYLDITPDFVAISKTKDFAYEAIKNEFIDYILNPISELQLRKFLLRFKKNNLNKYIKRYV